MVIYLSYLFSKYVAAGASKINAAKYMKIIDRIAFGQDKMIVILQIGEKYYLTGISSQTIQILQELDKNDLVDLKATLETGSFSTASFKSMMQNYLSKKGKD